MEHWRCSISQDVTLLDIDSPALEWLLRGRNLQTVSALDFQEAPAIVISSQTEGLNLPIAYRGQDFTWRREPFWELLESTSGSNGLSSVTCPTIQKRSSCGCGMTLFIDTSQSLPQ